MKNEKTKTKNEDRKSGFASNPLAVVLMSGGLDSCVAAAVAQKDFELAAFHANYGQRTLERELAAFRAQAAFFQAVAGTGGRPALPGGHGGLQPHGPEPAGAH